MSNDCEDIRIMLVESAYDELDPMDAKILEGHLLECAECARRRDALAAVRADLRAWEGVEAAPSRVTFVGMGRSGGASRETGRWRRRLAAAASFVLGFLLIAAAVNLELTHDDGGWTLRTSLLPRDESPVRSDQQATRPLSGPVERIGGDATPPALPVAQPSASGPFRVMPELDSWLDQRLQAQEGIQRVGVGRGFELRPEQVQPVLEQLLRKRDEQVQALVSNMLASAQSRQDKQLEDAMTGLYQTFDAQRTNDILFLAGQLGLLQEATGQELQQTNAAIEYLISLRAAEGEPESADAAKQPPEERRQ